MPTNQDSGPWWKPCPDSPISMDFQIVNLLFLPWRWQTCTPEFMERSESLPPSVMWSMEMGKVRWWMWRCLKACIQLLHPKRSSIKQPAVPTVVWATRPSILHPETSMHVQTDNFWLYPHRCSRCLKTLQGLSVVRN